MNLKSIKKCPALYKTLLAVRQVGGRAWMRGAYMLRGIRKNTVVFSSFKGRSYSDSPRFISEALHVLRPDIDIVWQLSNPADAPDYVRTVKPRSLSALTAIATARCIVDNFNRPIYMKKSPGQLYVQTWHGDRGFKKILFDMNTDLKFPDGEQIDLAVSGSEFGANIYRSAFRYRGEVLQVGMPRNDALVTGNPARAKELRRALKLENVKIMLYAPTFRDATAGKAQEAGFDLTKALDALEKSTHKKWICLTRAHDQNKGISAATDDRLRDVTAYPEMSDLLLISDLLITDYSSSAGDFALLNRPVVLYQPDLETFAAADRAFYYDPRTAPYGRAESEPALLALLSRFDEIPADGEAMKRFYGVTETGQSAKKTAEWISNRID